MIFYHVIFIYLYEYIPILKLFAYLYTVFHIFLHFLAESYVKWKYYSSLISILEGAAWMGNHLPAV